MERRQRPSRHERNTAGDSGGLSLPAAALILAVLLTGCGLPATPTPLPTATPWVVVVTATPTPTPEPSSTPSPLPTSPILQPTTTPAPITSPASTPRPTVSPLLAIQEQPGTGGHPTLADLWDGRAGFVVEIADTGLPMGESDTVVTGNGELWSYLHASQRSAGAVDRCGDPVEFPGCTVLYRSHDGGYSFQHDDPPVCLFDCLRCPCDSKRDHVDQQQYPRVAFSGETMVLVYEYRARVMLRRSTDGLSWGAPEEVPGTGIWLLRSRDCAPAERIQEHPHTPRSADCLAGGPPGVYVEGNQLYVFVGLGSNPGSMGCYRGDVDAPAGQLHKCQHDPLFTGAAEYGPLDARGPSANAFFDYRIVSSAEVQKIGDRYYMLYEGLRGPGPGDTGDTQFGLGLARSLTDQIDGPWARFPDNPILTDLLQQPTSSGIHGNPDPANFATMGNIGLGHADLVVVDGQTLLYTSLDGVTRSRLVLIWK